MSVRVERELLIAASLDEVWEVVTSANWLADEVELRLEPGGEASFRTGTQLKTGWVEEVLAPERLAFWWAEDEEPATRVELTLTAIPDGTWVRVVESRPLDLLDLVGTPLPNISGRHYGPALVAA
jgi:uncharacterized protein YndB with AHSA1/START domain